MNLDKLKKDLERALGITKWSPSKAELEEIAKRLEELNGQPGRAELSKIVLGVVKSYESYNFEGIDNSDLVTLFSLAKKPAGSDDK
ncbi:hypothetical protein [Pseudoalteromonas rubra]|uniref:hypothetical protein n=1 Tax=Pseudoalteromonas rubra TaxID=43658 RepID=UPI000F766D82|nr:hypothetical protein [Pseudoalteromonas rubra]